MRQTLSVHLRRKNADTMATRLQGTVARVGGANQHRRYVVERARSGLWKVVKIT